MLILTFGKMVVSMSIHLSCGDIICTDLKICHFLYVYYMYILMHLDSVFKKLRVFLR